MKHSGYIGVERNKYGEEKQRYIWYSKNKNLIKVECLYIEWMNEFFIYKKHIHAIAIKHIYTHITQWQKAENN